MLAPVCTIKKKEKMKINQLKDVKMCCKFIDYFDKHLGQLEIKLQMQFGQKNTTLLRNMQRHVYFKINIFYYFSKTVYGKVKQYMNIKSTC